MCSIRVDTFHCRSIISLHKSAASTQAEADLPVQSQQSSHFETSKKGQIDGVFEIVRRAYYDRLSIEIFRAASRLNAGAMAWRYSKR